MTSIQKFLAIKQVLEAGAELVDVVGDAIDDLVSGRGFSESDVSYLLMAYDIERGIGDTKGLIIGPYQFSEIAWSEAGEGDWATNALDPILSAKAALKYREINAQRFARLFPGREYTDDIAYLYHNQGPSGAAHYLTTGTLRFPKQSKSALALFTRIKV